MKMALGFEPIFLFEFTSTIIIEYPCQTGLSKMNINWNHIKHRNLVKWYCRKHGDDVFLALQSRIHTHSEWLLRSGVWQFNLPLSRNNWHIFSAFFFSDMATLMSNITCQQGHHRFFRHTNHRGTEDLEWSMSNFKLSMAILVSMAPCIMRLAPRTNREWEYNLWEISLLKKDYMFMTKTG